MADEILIAEETELLLIDGQMDLLVETALPLTELLEVAQQGPPGPPGPTGLEGPGGPEGPAGDGVDFVSDPLAYYILAKS